MAFQEFSKDYLNISVVQLFQHLFVLPPAEVLSAIFTLDLNDSESAKLSFVHLCSTAINFRMFSNKCIYILSNYTLAFYINTLSIIYFCILYFTYDLVNGAQFLNIATSFLSPACLAAASYPAGVGWWVYIKWKLEWR